jgi:hypothetical protein
MKSLIAYSFGWLLLIAVLIFLFSCEDGLEPLDERMDIASMSNTILDRNYVKRQWFYLETPGASFNSPAPGFGTVYLVTDKLPYADPIEVYVSLRLDLNEHHTYDGPIYYIDAYADPENNGLGDNVGVDSIWRGMFKKLAWRVDFDLIRDSQIDQYIGILLLQPLEDQRSLAVCYRATDGAVQFDVGDYDTNKGDQYNPRLAELICPPLEEFGPDSRSTFFPSTWKMMMRNVYELGIGDANLEFIDVRIEDRSQRPHRDVVTDASGVSYLRIFGLDRYDDCIPGKDGKIDLCHWPGILYPELGFLKFPWPEPFNPPQWVIEDILDPGYPEELLFEYDELVRNSILYDTLLGSWNDDAAHAYSIIVEWPSIVVKDLPDH